MRVFGKNSGQKPDKVETVHAERQDDLTIMVSWSPAKNALGYNIRYGIMPEKLYSSWQIYDRTQLPISSINKGQDYYITVDSFNEYGVTTGNIVYIS
jgi:hypothetical protein